MTLPEKTDLRARPKLAGRSFGAIIQPTTISLFAQITKELSVQTHFTLPPETPHPLDIPHRRTENQKPYQYCGQAMSFAETSDGTCAVPVEAPNHASND